MLLLLLLFKVVEFAKTFLDSHSLYYGNLSKEQVKELAMKIMITKTKTVPKTKNKNNKKKGYYGNLSKEQARELTIKIRITKTIKK